MSELEEIENWFTSQCDGVWEHHCGVNIQSCDNPGWWVRIDVRGTELENFDFRPVSEGDVEGETDISSEWIHCYVEEGVFNGAGDPLKLQAILRIFLDWKEKSLPAEE